MKLSHQVIQALCNLITAQPYRSGPQLVSFFNQLGWQDQYDRGFPSRWKYTEEKLLTVNDTPKMVEAIEQAVDPRNFIGTAFDVEGIIAELNQYLQYDGYELVKAGLNFKIQQKQGYVGHSSRIKNLIFASNGPKPEIILRDALNNDIEIVKNAEYCLVFEQSIPQYGLLWSTLVEWWAQQKGLPFPSDQAEFDLYNRLLEAIQSPAERTLFEVYYRRFRRKLGESFPVLIPQVYLHYDPKTLKELQGVKRLSRQRMDFLMLFADDLRVVIEIDGSHHYADGSQANPSKYAEMVSSDRELRLAGYELYRFGSLELSEPHGRLVAESFFKKLLAKHGFMQDTQG